MDQVDYKEFAALVEQRLKKLRNEFKNSSQKEQERAIVLALQEIRAIKAELEEKGVNYAKD